LPITEFSARHLLQLPSMTVDHRRLTQVVFTHTGPAMFHSLEAQVSLSLIIASKLPT